MSFRFLFVLLLIAGSIYTLTAQQKASIFKNYEKNPKNSILTDFSYAGYHYGESAIPNNPITINVKDKGIIPDLGKDLTLPLQQLIDDVGKTGGGVIFFPKGKYCVNMDTTRVQFLTIDYDNVVLRGEGDGVDGTIIYDGATQVQEDINPWISPSVIRFGYKIQSTKLFWGVPPLKTYLKFTKSPSAADPGSDGSILEAKIIAKITKDSKKGETKVYVDDARNIKSGDVILLAMYNTTDEGNLIQDILSYKPQDMTPDLATICRSGPEKVASFQWLVEVGKVQKNNIIVLKQPLRRDIMMKYAPAIAAAPMVREVGIENIRFESAWNGIYLHHGGGKYSPRKSKIMDYGWNAVNFCRVAHGWMRNVTISNYTNPIYLQDSRNVTIENVKISGYNGHCGIKIYAHAADNLARNIHFESNFSHMLSGEGNVYGNVFSRIDYNFRDSLPGDFDFHGSASNTYSSGSWNLFELIKGFNRISGGGAAYNFPHTAKYNVWWNVQAQGITKPTELFYHWVWGSAGKTTEHYKMYPGSIIVGYYSDNKQLLIDGSENDISTPLLYVEGLNKGQVYPLSLYDEQLTRRLK